MEDKKFNKRVLVAVFFILFTSTIAYASIDPDAVMQLLSKTMSHQVTQFTISFTIAAWLHSSRVKTEIKNQFASVVSSIDGVTQALRQDLSAQAQRIGNIENGMTRLATRVDNLESKKQNQ